MPLEVAYAFDDVGNSTLVLDRSGKERHLVLTGTNGTQVAGGHDRGALGKTGATMPVLPAAVLAACQTDDRTIMVDYQADLTTWIVRFNDSTFGSGMWGLLNFGSPNAVQGQVRDNAGGHNLMTRPSATAPGAVWHNYCLTYVRSTGVASIYRDGVFVISQTFTAGTQLSTSANSIDLAEWSTTGPTVDNLRLYSHALTAADIAPLANAPVVLDSPILIRMRGPVGPDGMPANVWQGIPADPVAGAQTGALAISSASAMTFGATLEQMGALPLQSTSALTLAATRTQPGTLTIASSSTLGLAGTVTQPGALAITSASALSLAGVREVPAALAIPAPTTLTLGALLDQHAALAIQETSTLALGGTVTQPAALALQSTAVLTLGATLDQHAALALTSASTLSLAGTVSQPAVLSLQASAALALGATVTRLAALPLGSVSDLQLNADGDQTGALAIVSSSSLALAGTRGVPAALAIGSVSSLTIAGTVTSSQTAALAVQATTLLGLTGDRQIVAALALLTAASLRIGFQEETGSLIIQAGLPEYVRWLEGFGALAAERAVTVSWLGSGAGRPA